MRTVEKCGDKAQWCSPNTSEQPSILISLSPSVFASTSLCRWGCGDPEKRRDTTRVTELESAKATLVENRVWFLELVGLGSI